MEVTLDDDGIAPDQHTPIKSPAKTRSFSDPSTTAPTALQPSPTFHERIRQGSKDDTAAVVPSTPRPFRRPDFSRGLSLQMPPPSSAQTKVDELHIFMQTQNLSASPATSLPRHSRGLDFSRACTNLHHSTIAEQSSPDSSPVITQKGMMIPLRKGSVSSMMLDSPNLNGSGGWGALAPERSTVSSSVGSVNMLGSEEESSSSDEDASVGGDIMDAEDAIFTTPQVHKLQNPSMPTPFAGPQTPGGVAPFSPAQTALMRTARRARLQRGAGKRSRKSSSSASNSNSGYSSMASPRATSPPALRSIESAATGYFSYANAAKSRRESLAMGTDGLHLSSGNDSGDEQQQSQHTTAPSTPGVVRRPVTRRGNLLPKTKGFARIRAALAEEAAPVDTEIRRESETIRQVRERDNSVSEPLDASYHERPGTATAASSPCLLPAVPESIAEEFGEELLAGDNAQNKGLGVMNFAAQASRNSGGLDYWNRFDPSIMRTPPPPPSFARQGSSLLPSDMALDSPSTFQHNNDGPLYRRPRARSSASDASEAFFPTSSSSTTATAPSAPVNDDVVLKKFKRRREDDFDIATIKRRAVSPGMSAQNSPVLTHSPSSRDLGGGGMWGLPPPPGERKREGELREVRSNSGGSSVGGGGGLGMGKKLGLQGMVDTHDGLMKMSIE